MIQDALLGIEYDWLAIDAIGHVGWFLTAGSGLAPSDIIERIDAHDAAIETIGSIAPTMSALECPGEGEFLQAAARGLFVFDSTSEAGPYERIAAPIVPVLISDLPEIFAIARRVQLRCDFRELSKVPRTLVDEHG